MKLYDLRNYETTYVTLYPLRRMYAKQLRYLVKPKSLTKIMNKNTKKYDFVMLCKYYFWFKNLVNKFLSFLFLM